MLFILCFTITNILHFLGYNDITDLISVYKIGLIINLLFGYIIVYNSIAMYLVNYNPQREIEKHTIYKYLPKGKVLINSIEIFLSVISFIVNINIHIIIR